MSVLSHRVVTASEQAPEQLVAFLHGILGSKSNWGSIARRFVEAEPSWGAVLIDLRKHGESQDFTPPHTIDACAQDLLALEPHLPAPVSRIVGHSFGGKVGTRWASQTADLQHLFIVDSNPGISGPTELRSEIVEVVNVLSRAPQRIESRRAFAEFAMAQGLSEPTARWLAMNVKEDAPDQAHLNLDLNAIQELLQDFRNTDCWGDIEQILSRADVDLIVGAKSDAFDEAGKERAQQMAAQHTRFHLHTIENSGHWVHVDAPKTLLEILLAPEQQP